MNDELKIDPERKYIVEVPGIVFANPPPNNHPPFKKQVSGEDIRNHRCPFCGGRGVGAKPNIAKNAGGTVKIVGKGWTVTCPLCNGTGEFDYSKASGITLVND